MPTTQPTPAQHPSPQVFACLLHACTPARLHACMSVCLYATDRQAAQDRRPTAGDKCLLLLRPGKRPGWRPAGSLPLHLRNGDANGRRRTSFRKGVASPCQDPSLTCQGPYSTYCTWALAHARHATRLPRVACLLHARLRHPDHHHDHGTADRCQL